MRTTKYLLVLLAALVIGCGDNTNNSGADGGGGGDGSTTTGDGGGGGGGDGGGGGGGDGGTINPDGGNSSACGLTQCSNCLDDDNDGTIDGFDIECVSAADNDEGSFATGIPGDNKDSAKQDCFFDGDSGAGNDGCVLETCCLLGDCAAGTDCTISQQCIDFCAPATPPGCDCFGCCTICEGADCRDVLINPAIAPNCDADTINDTTLCPTCTKVDSCSTTCEPSGCILCPGQTEADLPAECNNQNLCPEGQTACESGADCAADEYCGNGCCLTGIIVQ